MSDYWARAKKWCLVKSTNMLRRLPNSISRTHIFQSTTIRQLVQLFSAKEKKSYTQKSSKIPIQKKTWKKSSRKLIKAYIIKELTLRKSTGALYSLLKVVTSDFNRSWLDNCPTMIMVKPFCCYNESFIRGQKWIIIYVN